MNKDNLLNINDADAPIYRVIPANRFLDLLASTKNGLVHPSKWNDPFENFFLRAKLRGPAGERISIKSLADSWYGQCWTYNNDTDAMWCIYSPGNHAIQIKTTVRKLFESFYNDADEFACLKFFCGNVCYYTEADIINFMKTVTFYQIASGGRGHGCAELLCVKREAFRYEKAVRLLFQDLNPKRGSHGVALFDIDVNAVFEEVVIDPRVDESGAASLITTFKAAGCTLPISHSRLYSIPSFTIPLS
jgi:hypothetical protein